MANNYNRYGQYSGRQQSNRYSQPSDRQQTNGYGQPVDRQQTNRYGQPIDRQQTNGYSQPVDRQPTNRYGQPVDRQSSNRQQVNGYRTPYKKEETTQNTQADVQQYGNKSNKDRLKEITDSIETGIKELFSSDKYKQYLQTMSRFHRYSLNNQMLIYMQKPDATHVAGFNKWRDQFKRNVKKGEKGIKIIAPTPYKKKIEQEKLDPDTKLPMIDEKGNVIMEEKEIEVPMYRVVTVFDVSQTDGKPLPSLASSLEGNVQNFKAFVEAVRRSSSVPIKFEEMEQSTDGYFSLTNQEIVIRKGMSEIQTVSALLHEMAHSKLHNITNEQEQEGDERAKRLSRNTKEVQAESVSFAVCAYYNIKTDDNSFGYIASWSKDKDLPELKASLDTITKTANKMINDIDKNFAEVKKEWGIDEKSENDKAMYSNGVSYMYIHRDSDSNWAYELYTNDKFFNMADGVVNEPSLNVAQVKDKVIELCQIRDNYDELLSKADMNTLLKEIEEKSVRLDKSYMPDPDFDLMDMHRYGYTYDNMLPLGEDMAKKLFNNRAMVYALYDDDTEGLVTSAREIDRFQGMFGIEIPDWEWAKEQLKSAERTAARTTAKSENGANLSGTAAHAGTAQREDKLSKKPSLLGKLKAALPPRGTQQQQHKKSNEMEM